MDAGGTGRARRALLGFERRWAELVFDAILGTDGDGGLPPLAALDRGVFWRALGAAPPREFGVGLRACVYGLTFLPLADRRWRRPLFALPRDDRRAAVEALADDRRHLVRQMVAAMKLLACFAYCDDPAVRDRLSPPP